MLGFNKTILVGCLGNNPSLKTSNGHDYALFSVCNKTVDKDGNTTTQTQKCVAFDKQCDLVMQYLRKGDLCCIEGTIDNYRKSQRVIAERITFLQRKIDK